MELYILDTLLRRSQVVDVFESLIWTERARVYGDFELVIKSTPETRKQFTMGVWLALNESYRVMRVETIENTVDSDGKASLKISGRSLEALMEDRIARNAMTSTTTEPSWVLTGTPGDVMRQIFHQICVVGSLNVADIIPFVVEGSFFPEDTIPEPETLVEISLEPTTVYDAIKNICELYDLSFRLVRGLDDSKLYFDVYSGSDRTSQQTSVPAVIFSPELDNLENTSEFASNETQKNVAYVFSPVGFEIVFPFGVDPEIDGFDRRVLLVKADEITTTDPDEASRAMVQKGLEELSKSRGVLAFDGELNQNSSYKYGKDYELGDLVELRNVDGVTNLMQVTEQIFVSDREGDRSYPTLALFQFITPGTWLSWNYSQVWQDVPDDLYWANA